MYNLAKHHRRSIRLKNYDYSREGLYFVTLVCQNRLHRFGKIEDAKMKLNEAGKVAQLCWEAIPKHFPQVVLHNYIIMPNHVHGILEIVPPMMADAGQSGDSEKAEGRADVADVAADVRANNYSPLPISPLPISPIPTSPIPTPHIPTEKRPKGTSKTVGSIVRGFKIGVTKWFRENTDVETLWLRNYYEHIIRSETAYQNIANYIDNNPANWMDDGFYV